MTRSIRIVLAAGLMILVAPRADAAQPFSLDVDIDVAASLVDLSPSHGATADNPAEPGGDDSAEALRVTLERLEIRRGMLTAHQVMAWTSLSTLFAAQAVGMVNRVSLQSGSPMRANLEPSLAIHRVLAGTAISTYYGAGMMAWLAPGPGGTMRASDKGISKWDNTRDKHIALSIAHNISMALTIATGALMANGFASKDWDGMVVAHTISAFTTGFLMIPAAVIISRF